MNEVTIIEDLPQKNKGSILVLIDTFKDSLSRCKQPTFSTGDLMFFIEELTALNNEKLKLPYRKIPATTGAISDFTAFEEARGWNRCLDEVISMNAK